MSYIVAYIIIGIFVYGIHAWIMRRFPTMRDRILQTIEKSSRSIESSRYPNGVPFSSSSARIVGEGIGMIIAVIGWPVVLVNIFRRLNAPKDSEREPDDSQTDTGEWIRPTTISEIEHEETVFDDMGTPPFPFGFLNPKWMEFKSQIQEGDEIWEYRHTPYSGQSSNALGYIAEGYAIRRNGSLVAKVYSSAGHR